MAANMTDDLLNDDMDFFYCKTDNLSCLNKKNCLVNSKVKGFSCGFMSSA